MVGAQLAPTWQNLIISTQELDESKHIILSPCFIWQGNLNLYRSLISKIVITIVIQLNTYVCDRLFYFYRPLYKSKISKVCYFQTFLGKGRWHYYKREITVI